MIDYSNRFLLILRSLGRRLGIARPLLNLVRRLRPREYEAEIRSELVKRIRRGQTVWDIGANEGFYTDLLLKLVGPGGIVVAFEPSPASFGILEKKYSSYPNVYLENVALSDREGVAPFFISPITVTNSLARNENFIKDEIQVSVKRGDSYASSLFPEIVKIDVEGFELEVLNGMHRILNSPRLECVFLEVHFSILSERGLPGAPATIVQMLTQAGLVVRWTDSSHLLACRARSFQIEMTT